MDAEEPDAENVDTEGAAGEEVGPYEVDYAEERWLQKVLRANPRASRRSAATLLRSAREQKARGEAAEALELQVRVLDALRERFGDDDELALGVLVQVATTAFELGWWEEAFDAYRQLEESYARIHGAEDPRTLKVQVWEGLALEHLDRAGEALRILDGAVSAAREVLGGDAEELAGYLTILARAQVRAGDPSGAEASIREGLDIRSRGLGEDDPRAIASLRDLARLRFDQGDLDEATVLAQSLVVRSTEQFGPDHERTVAARELLERIGRSD